MHRSSSRIAVFAGVVLAARLAVAEPYNPYAVAAEAAAPVAADGTLRWGTYFKSADLQLAYERLWNLGACRGTSRAIMEPVAANRLQIDRLPESDFEGVVQAAGGGLAGGVVAFSGRHGGDTAAPLFAQLHPAGVSRLSVTGRGTVADIRPGMAVKLQTRVDARGRAAEPVGRLTLVTPRPDFRPLPVRPDRLDELIGGVVSCRSGVLVLRVDAGKVRRLTLPLADGLVVDVDGAYLELVGPGDAVAVKGRMWSGEGAAGSGTIFASHVTVTKRPPAGPEIRAVAVDAGAGEVRPVE